MRKKTTSKKKTKWETNFQIIKYIKTKFLKQITQINKQFKQQLKKRNKLNKYI